MKGGRADVWTERERGGAAGKPSLTRRFYLKCCVEDKQLFPAGLSECSGRQLSEEGGGERAYSLMPTEELRLFNATHSLIQTERKPHPLSTNVGRSSSMMCKVVHKHEASIHTHSAVTWFLPPPTTQNRGTIPASAWSTTPWSGVSDGATSRDTADDPHSPLCVGCTGATAGRRSRACLRCS